MTRSGFARVGESAVIRGLVKATSGGEEALPTTHLEEGLLQAAVETRDQPDDDELAYMARELVQCTLPHSDPGQVPFWARQNGNLTLSIVSDFDPATGKLVGYPFGTIPRLLLFWLTTEALRTGSPKLELGKSYSGFLSELGLSPDTGGGKRGDAFRVRVQTRRLFTSRISFIQECSREGVEGEARVFMNVARKTMLWWDPKKPNQMNLFGSWVELSEDFFRAITTSPVPLDLRALRALKRSPLALDLYAWATHKAHVTFKKGKPQFVPWVALARQFGSDYADHLNFKKKAKAALRKIQIVFPTLRLQDAQGGITVLPSSRPAVAPKKVRRLTKPR